MAYCNVILSLQRWINGFLWETVRYDILQCDRSRSSLVVTVKFAKSVTNFQVRKN